MKKILIPVAEFHRGNTATYVERALKILGVESRIIDEKEFHFELEKSSELQTKFLCVDSGKPFDLLHPAIAKLPLDRVGYWFIDFRHHKHGPRVPTDVAVCKELDSRDGLIFQSQFEDFQYSLNQGWTKSTYLPLAADTEIWGDAPAETKIYHLAFAGNVWDKGRAEILQYLLEQKQLRFGFPGHGALWMQDAAKFIRLAIAGFNVNSYYGSEYAYDVNMRFYETLSCGVPLITNWVPELDRMFDSPPNFLRVYEDPAELPSVLNSCLNDEYFLRSGAEARQWIVNGQTYVHRMKKVLEVFGLE